MVNEPLKIRKKILPKRRKRFIILEPMRLNPNTESNTPTDKDRLRSPAEQRLGETIFNDWLLLLLRDRDVAVPRVLTGLRSRTEPPSVHRGLVCPQRAVRTSRSPRPPSRARSLKPESGRQPRAHTTEYRSPPDLHAPRATRTRLHLEPPSFSRPVPKEKNRGRHGPPEPQLPGHAPPVRLHL